MLIKLNSYVFVGSLRDLEWEVLLTLALGVCSALSMICALYTCWTMWIMLDSLFLPCIVIVLTCLLENGYMIILAQAIELDFVVFSLSCFISCNICSLLDLPKCLYLTRETNTFLLLVSQLKTPYFKWLKLLNVISCLLLAFLKHIKFPSSGIHSRHRCNQQGFIMYLPSINKALNMSSGEQMQCHHVISIYWGEITCSWCQLCEAGREICTTLLKLLNYFINWACTLTNHVSPSPLTYSWLL